MTELKEIAIDVEVNSVIENGRRSFAETPNDILRRMLLRHSAAPSSPATGAERLEEPAEILTAQSPAGGSRRTGRWTVEFRGRAFAAHNLKGAYQSVLLLLSGAFPDFLEKFAQEQGRARRFVARSPVELYLTTPRLAKKHAAPLKDGWYFDTNLSTDQVARRIRIAARTCGLRYGSDLRVLNNFEQI
ncbi:MAG TPA: hypothetical protein VF577_07315 [Allosphingosinicella sp.]|jgi:negative regulator of replication initiation